MNRRIVIYLLSFVLFPLSIQAQKVQPQPATLTTEQEQQFTYYWYAARQAIDEERYADALALLEFCRMVKPDDGATLTFLGVLYNGLGQTDRALASYRAAFAADPRDQWYKYSYALLELRTEEGDKEALQVLEKAYQIQSGKGAKNKGDKNHVDEELMEQLKRLYISNQQWEKALQIQDRIDMQKGYDAYSALARYRIYILWGKPKQALKAIDKYLESDPTDIRFLLVRMETMERMNVNKKELYAMYQRVLALDPYHLGVLNNYAYHLATHDGDLKEAERMSAITIREEPNNPVYLDTYGWILHLQGQDELALFYLKRALTNATDGSKREIEKHIKSIEK